MVSIPKVVGILSCGVLLSLGLCNTARAEHTPSPSDVMKTDSVTDRQGFQSDDDRQENVDHKHKTGVSLKTIIGELVRVQDENYFVTLMDGKEVRFHTDKTTEMKGEIQKGDRIKVEMNDQNHAVSIGLAR